MAWRVGSAALLALSLSLSAPAASRAAEAEHQTDYTISLAGLPIARASFHTVFTDDRYSISGKLSSAGLADILSSTSGQTSVSGVIEPDKLSATDYSVRYKSGKKARAIDVSFADGNVTSATLRPERRTPKNWVPVTKADMRNVVDPLSGLIFPADAKVCPKTLPVFDGESRMDFKLSAKGSKPFKTDGFSGDVIVCGVKFVPRSGYKKGRSDVEYLKKLDTMEIWFAKAEAGNVYAPVYVRVPTKYGPVTVWATRFKGDVRS
ncbi:DUF3108 domain-containing protein [Rhizobium sp. CC-YZS058]|uniref:DUF3108 domain-containing protein n=1 Tax=Rhizobium sp. CC-YZS058 TaxID=3042153 RepID=UPI002B05D991|nr:DUF3108 domain-containing protein [Rhizobium sp. CC-YZS058]MEA3533787.1 DUF3108 domain-containing protein [Rhizobium sp. CC-YZS058]